MAVALRHASSTFWLPKCCLCTGLLDLVQAMFGIKLSEATCLGYIQRLYDALEAWEVTAAKHLLTCPEPCR